MAGPEKKDLLTREISNSGPDTGPKDSPNQINIYAPRL